MGTLGELAVVAAALIVTVVIWNLLQAGKKKREDRESSESGLPADRYDSSDGGSDGGGD